MKKIITTLALNALAVFCVGQNIINQYDNLGRLTQTNYPGGQSISYTYDNAGNRIRSQTIIPCADIPNPVITASGATTFCAGGSVVLTSDAGASYLWSNGATTQTITVSTSGNYSVAVTYYAGCVKTSNGIPVTVNPLPTITASSNSPVCESSSLLLSSSGGISFLWSGPNGFNSTQQNPTGLSLCSSRVNGGLKI